MTCCPQGGDMEILREGIDIDRFFREVSDSSEKILMLDYDGTLSPYRVQRDAAVPYPGIREILGTALAGAQCRTVIVSGRSIADLLPLLGMENTIELWGCHGWERMRPGGPIESPDLPPSTLSGLREAAAWARREGLEERIESKPATVALHWRGLDAAGRRTIEEHAREVWKVIGDSAGLRLHDFNGGMELRPPGMDKGRVVRMILSESEVAPAAAYLGDDMTDEDAFTAIRGRGLGVLVSTRPRVTRADLRIAPPDELLWFLNRWVERCRSQ